MRRVACPSASGLLGILSFVLLAALWSGGAEAQSVPSQCRPVGNYDCAARFPKPYSYLAGSCAAGVYASEAGAFAVYRQQFAGSSCPTSFSPVGWISPAAPKASGTDFVVSCGGYSYQYPAMAYGEEHSNWLLEDVTRATPPACANPTTIAWGAVRRDRTFACPEGYSVFSGDVCYRSTGALRDYAKNYGTPCDDGQCPTENPINIGAANKFRAEVDYRAGGSSPLGFTRYYNSFPQNASFSHHYRDTNFEFYGLNAYASLSSQPSEGAGRYENLGLGAVGVGWRHSYQRSIHREVSTLITNAYAYRADGKVLVFTKKDGQWYAQLDVDLRLEETVDGGGAQTGWKLTREDASTETFDLAGRLTLIRSRAGVDQSLAYDSCGRLTSVTDSFGKALAFGYTIACDSGVTTAEVVSSITVPGGGTYQYAYDSQGRLTSVTDPAGYVLQYHYENTTYKAALTGITDESNQRYATFAYDSEGRPTLSELAGGANSASVNYPYGGLAINTATLTNALGGSATYDFTVKQGVVKVSTQSAYCEGCPINAKSLSYDANGNVSIRKDFNNIETRYTYNLTRNLETSRTEAYGTPKARTITTQWHATFRLPTQIDEPNRRTTFTHDSSGNVLTRTITDLSVTPNVARTWTFTYNGFGQVLTVDGPRTDVSDVTTFTYHACSTGFECGELETITNALGHETTYAEYNAHGQPLSITDPNGVETALVYDARQRVTSYTVGGEQTSFEYWPTGLLKKTTLPDGSYLQYTYDAAHRLTQVSDAENNRIVYTLDAAGNRTKEETFDPTNALASLHHRAFNTLNQLWKEIGADNTAAVTTTFGYDANGNQTSAAAPLGRNSSNLYDELNRLKQITDPASGITLLGYDANDNLTSVTDPRGKVTSYAYTGFGEVKQLVSPDTGTTTSTYDSAGNLATSTDARNETGTYLYDALNRVTGLDYGDESISFTYDTGTGNKGRLIAVDDDSGSTEWTYTSLGRFAMRVQTMGSVSKTVGYGYNSAGQLTSVTTPSGQTLTYAYSNNRISGITINSTTLLNNVLYEPFGPARAWTWGNSTSSTRDSDLDGNAESIASAGSLTYSHDDAFRITGITDLEDSSQTWGYGYDSLDRLATASKTGLSQAWTYDANGNRLTEGGTQSSTFTIATTSNRLMSVSGATTRTYSYDAAGHTTGYAGLTLGYSDSGRLKTISGAASASYQHNALGERVKKTVGSATTYFVYDDAGHLLGEYDGSGGLIQETVWMGDIPVATLRPNGSAVDIYYVHTDHLNTPRRITRPSDAAIVWRWDSDPFGTTSADEDPDGDQTEFVYHLRFPGQYLDEETGLHYNYFRDYDSVTGRYVESDPIGLRGGLNTYAYANGNPILLFDSLGLKVELRCRPVGNPSRLSWSGIIAGAFGGEHCFLVVSCDSPKEIPETTISYPSTAAVTDWAYSNIEAHRSMTIFPPGSEWKDGAPCPTCEFEQCIIDEAKRLQDSNYYMSNYDAIRGPNSNSFAKRLVEKCGGAIRGTPPLAGWESADRVGF
jgi:RHS repeat-associated protein